MSKKAFISFFCSLFFVAVNGQTTFYRDIYKGGMALRMFSSQFSSSSSTYIDFPIGSRIKKGYLIAGNQFGTKYSTTVKLNGIPFTFDKWSEQSNKYEALSYGSDSTLECSSHVIDVTSAIDTSINVYELQIDSFESVLPPEENNTNLRYINYTLVVLFDNDSYPKLCVNVFLNNENITDSTSYNYTNLPPINTYLPCGYSIVMGSMMHLVYDGSYIFINNDSIGLVGTNNERTYWYPQSFSILDGFGIIGQYDYINGNLLGIGDDEANNIMDSTDVLADISSYLSNQATSFTSSSVYQGYKDEHPAGNGNGKTNPIWATFLTYSTKCDTLHSYINVSDTTICAGESLELRVGGDSTYTYSWRYRGDIVSNDTTLNIAPLHNQLYSILVSDTSGCSKTEIINIKVNENPTLYSSKQNTVCPNNNGVVIIDSVQGIASPYRYNKDNGNWQTAPVFANLSEGDYNIGVIDTNGCVSTQVITITDSVDTEAYFSIPSLLDNVPTTLTFENQSQNASEYQWFVNGELVTTDTDLSYLFEEDGEHALTLVASKPNGLCTDTLTKTLQLESNNSFLLPSIWEVDNNLLVISNGYNNLQIKLLNNLGQVVLSREQTLNNGQNIIIQETNLARGMYFYQIEAVDQNGKTEYFGGKLMRI